MKRLFNICLLVFVSLIISGCSGDKTYMCEGNSTLNANSIKVQYILKSDGEILKNYDVKMIFDDKDDTKEICKLLKEVNSNSDIKDSFECKSNYIIYKDAIDSEKYGLNQSNIIGFKEYITDYGYTCNY